MNKKYVSALTLMALALAGCTQPAEPTQPTPPPTQNVPGVSSQIKIPTPTLESSDLTNILSESDPTKAPQVTQETAPAGVQKDEPLSVESTDQKKYATAVRNSDPKICELIINADTKAACVRDVATTVEPSDPKAVVTTDQGSTSQENLTQ